MDAYTVVKTKEFNDHLMMLINKYANDIPALCIVDKLNIAINQLSPMVETQYKKAVDLIKESEVSADGEKDN